MPGAYKHCDRYVTITRRIHLNSSASIQNAMFNAYLCATQCPPSHAPPPPPPPMPPLPCTPPPPPPPQVSTVDQYNPDKDEWQPVAKMSLRRSGLGVGVAPAFLY